MLEDSVALEVDAVDITDVSAYNSQFLDTFLFSFFVVLAVVFGVILLVCILLDRRDAEVRKFQESLQSETLKAFYEARTPVPESQLDAMPLPEKLISVKALHKDRLKYEHSLMSLVFHREEDPVRRPARVLMLLCLILATMATNAFFAPSSDTQNIFRIILVSILSGLILVPFFLVVAFLFQRVGKDRIRRKNRERQRIIEISKPADCTLAPASDSADDDALRGDERAYSPVRSTKKSPRSSQVLPVVSGQNPSMSTSISVFTMGRKLPPLEQNPVDRSSLPNAAAYAYECTSTPVNGDSPNASATYDSAEIEAAHHQEKSDRPLSLEPPVLHSFKDRFSVRDSVLLVLTMGLFTAMILYFIIQNGGQPLEIAIVSSVMALVMVFVWYRGVWVPRNETMASTSEEAREIRRKKRGLMSRRRILRAVLSIHTVQDDGKSFLLPAWMIVIPYFLVLLLIAFFVHVLILYSVGYSDDEQAEWCAGTVIGFISDILLMEPIVLLIESAGEVVIGSLLSVVIESVFGS
eukprot:ANDGO_01446.mRNA.1 hypothetical protein